MLEVLEVCLFIGRIGAYQSGHLWCIPKNIRLVKKSWPGTNTSAYLSKVPEKKKKKEKSFVTLTTDVIVKTFFSLQGHCSNKLECSSLNKDLALPTKIRQGC